MSATTHVPHQPLPHVPVPPTPLIGREREIEAASQLVLRDDVRLVTLVGPPGVGKTRLALAVASCLRDASIAGAGSGRAFAHGVWFVPLEPLHDPHLVTSTIAQVLGVTEAGGRPLQEALRAFVQLKRLLLVLDNFEQVLTAAPDIAELLAAAPNLKALVTSRAALRISAEHRFLVPPLSLPPVGVATRPEASGTGPPGAWGRVEAGDVPGSAAVRLFVARATAARSDFALTPENEQAVAAICHRLDGLPLALELAAARIAVLAPRTLLVLLERRLPLLADGARDQPARHRTLRGAIGWSYDLLGETTQVVFRRLGTFAGGATLEAVEAVCQPERNATEDASTPLADESPSVFDRLASLVEASLVEQDAPAGDAPRFHMLETIREYALERLEAIGEDEPVRRRHARYFLVLAETAAPYLAGAPAQRGAWLDRLEADHDNLRQALAWTQSAPAAGVDGGGLTVRLAAALGEFWRRRGYWSEGRRWLAAALTLPAAAQPSAAWAKLLQDAGTLAVWQGDYAGGGELLEASVAAWRELGDRRGLARALVDLVWPRQNTSNFAGARAAAEESVTLWRELGDRSGLAHGLRWLAHAVGTRPEASAAERRQAEALWRESVALFREVGDDEGASLPLAMLGWLARVRGDYAAARSYYEQVAALRPEATPGGRVALALIPLAVLESFEGDAARAEQHLKKALRLCRDAGHGLCEAEALTLLGDLARKGGYAARAADLYAAGLAVARRAGGTALIASALAGLADLARKAGDPARARALYGEALHALRNPANRRPDALGMTTSLVRCLIGLAEVEAAQGRPERAARLLGAALNPMAAVGRQLEPPDAADHAAAVDVVHSVLAEPAFAAAFAAGETMSPAQAGGYALGANEPPAMGAAAAPIDRRRGAGGRSPLTPRELEVARLVATGLANRGIADTLHVSERTVENHVSHIFAKLGVHSRVQIATWVVELGQPLPAT